jgi:hypothetical protein
MSLLSSRIFSNRDSWMSKEPQRSRFIGRAAPRPRAHWASIVRAYPLQPCYLTGRVATSHNICGTVTYGQIHSALLCGGWHVWTLQVQGCKEGLTIIEQIEDVWSNLRENRSNVVFPWPLPLISFPYRTTRRSIVWASCTNYKSSSKWNWNWIAVCEYELIPIRGN